MTLSVVIPLYIDRLELIRIVARCLESLTEHYPDVELIVVDDCSPVYHDFPVTLRNATNLGYTTTVNRGLTRATGDVLVVANDDLTFYKGDLDRFYAIEAGIYSPKTTDEGFGSQFGAIWGMNRETFRRMGFLNEQLRHYFSDKEYYDRAKKLKIPVVKWREVVIEHVGGATYKNRKDLFTKDQETYEHLRSCQ